MDKLMGGRMKRWMDGLWVGGLMDELGMDGWMDGQIDGWKNEGMDRWIVGGWVDG